MKSTELRIGNLIQTEKYGVKIEVKAIFGKYGLECGNSGNDYDDYSPDIKDVKPIPLTEEWLIKFGFEAYSTHVNYIELQIKSNKPSNHVVIRYGLQRDYFNIFNHSECDFTEMQYLTEVKFVHQLQNLFYCLSGGEELTIKEL